MGNEAPPHRLHDERRLLRSGATDDGCVRARCDVVAGHEAISLHPLIDVECGVAVELLDFVCLYFRDMTEDWLRIRGAIRAHLKCECESTAHVVVVVAWCYAPAWRTGGASPFISWSGAKGYTAVRLYPVRVREYGAARFHDARERLAVYIYRTGGTRAAERGAHTITTYDLNVERKREGEPMRGVMMMRTEPTAVCHVPFD